MPQSLKSRFNGNKEEVLAYTKTYGRGPAMRKYDIRTYTSFKDWLEEETGDENYGINPTIRPDGQPLGDQVLNAFLKYVSESKIGLEALKAENELLRERLRIRKLENEKQAIPVLEACEA